MKNEHKEKLNKLLEERRERIKSLRHFNENFEMFVHEMLIRIVDELNLEIHDLTEDRLKLYMGDPYENSKRRYYVLVQFMIGGHRRQDFYLDNTKNYPALSFEGNEVNGKIEIGQKLVNEDSFKKLYDTIADGIDEDKIIEIFINFIDQVYKL